MDLPELHADRLRAFLAVAREGGFSRAARALGRTQSSLSQAVRALEVELGETLFVRDAREVELTEAGLILREHAERAFEEISRARDALLSLRKLTRGTLRVGTSDSLATYVLPQVFAAFRDRYPAVELRLSNRTSPAVASAVALREVDLGIVTLPLPETWKVEGQLAREVVRVEELATQEDVLICPPGHALSRKRAVTLSALEGVPMVMLDRSTAGRALFDATLAEHGVRVHVVMEMSSVEVLKKLVELRFGLSVVPAFAARRECQQGSLHAVRLRGLPVRPIALVTPTLGPLSHAARAFADVLRKELRSVG